MQIKSDAKMQNMIEERAKMTMHTFLDPGESTTKDQAHLFFVPACWLVRECAYVSSY